MNAMRKVLVVDDDPVVSKSFDRVLTRRGYVVVSAENGAEALRKVAQEEYEAVFTDIKMPGMDGIEVARRMRMQQPWTPVVIITGYGSAENETQAKAAGVRTFLRKPLSPEMIETSLQEAIAEAAPATVPESAAAATVTEAAPVVEEAGAPRGAGEIARNLAMFFAAPFIALGYVMLFPFIGAVMLARTAAHAWRVRHPVPAAEAGPGVGQVLKNLGMFLAAPFIALGYILLFPFIGLGLLTRMAGEAWHKRHTAG